MNKKYKVLKKFGDFKKGEIFDATEGEFDGTEEDVLSLIEEGAIEEIVEEEEKKEDKKEGKVVAVTVEWRGNVREYSKEIHGEKFMDLAKEFAGKVNGELK